MIRSSAWLFATKLTVALLNFATVVMLSRWLGPADRGICGWYIVVIAVSLVFIDMIAGPAAGFLLKDFNIITIIKAVYQWALVISVVTAATLLALNRLSTTEACLLLLLCWLNAVNSLHQHLLLAQKKFRLFNLLSVLSPGLTVFFVMLLLRHFGPDKLFYLAGLAVSWLISFFLGLYFLQKQFVLTKISGGKSLWQTGFKNGLANQLSHLAGLLNNRFIYFLVPATLLGVYANALSLAEASLMIPTSIGQVLYASHLNNEKPTRFFETMAGNFLVNAVLLAGIAVLVLLIPASLYAYVFGPAFGGVKSYLALLSVFMIFYGGYLICSYRHSANGHFLYNFYANLAGTGINIAISLWYVVHNTYTPEKGIIALGSGFVAMFITSLILLNRKEIAARGKPFSPF